MSEQATPYSYRFERPALGADAVVFRVHPRPGRKREVLLVKRGKAPFKDAWALPGGFVEGSDDLKRCESAEQAARRELREETGLEVRHLSPVGFFDTPGRDPRGWVVAAAFWSELVVGVDHTDVQAGDDAAEAGWFDVDALPPLAFDHSSVIDKALEQLFR